MLIQKVTREIFKQLILSLKELSEAEYVESCTSLINHSIVEHVRHIIELFQWLENGYLPGLVNYDSRKRDVSIETDKGLAIALLELSSDQIDKPNKELVLYSSFGFDDKEIQIST